MFLFNIEKKTLPCHPSQSISRDIKYSICVTHVHYLTFLGLALAPVYSIKEFRNADGKKVAISNRTFPNLRQLLKFHRIQLLSMFSGLPILLLVFASFCYVERRLNPDDHAFRQAPKIDDIVFLNYYLISKDADQILMPYRMAKIFHISSKDKSVYVSLSTLSYGDKHTVTKEFFIRRDSHLSYYGGRRLKLSPATLMDKNLVWKIRRREFFVDIERHQSSTILEKNFQTYPENKPQQGNN